MKAKERKRRQGTPFCEYRETGLVDWSALPSLRCMLNQTGYIQGKGFAVEDDSPSASLQWGPHVDYCVG
jgi:hypothetical protein